MELSTVKDKIQKLLALSSSPNEHEATLAAQKAQELLLRYNLSLTDLIGENLNQEVTREEVAQEKRKTIWKGQLGKAISESNFCEFWFEQTYYGFSHVFVGKTHNTETAKWLYNYLIDAIESLAKKATKLEKTRYKQYLEQMTNIGADPLVEPNWNTWRISFILGCTDRLCERLREQARKLKEDGITGTENTAPISAIVIKAVYERERQAIALWKQQNNIQLKRRSGRDRNIIGDGYKAGKEAGNNISMNKTIANKAKYLKA